MTSQCNILSNSLTLFRKVRKKNYKVGRHLRLDGQEQTLKHRFKLIVSPASSVPILRALFPTSRMNPPRAQPQLRKRTQKPRRTRRTQTTREIPNLPAKTS